MSDDFDEGDLDYWQYNVRDPEFHRLREIQSPPPDDDYDDDYDDYDRYSSRRFTPQVPAFTTHVSEPRRSYVKDGRAHSHTHGESLGKHLYQMFLDSDQCDVTLRVGTSNIKAHKLVLMANSDYFKAMFSSTSSEAHTGMISFEDNPYVTSNGLAAILEYAYTGSFQVTESTVREIVEAARHLLMPDVTKLCEMFVKDVAINIANYGLVFEIARDFKMDYVAEKCRRFVEMVELNFDNFAGILDFAQASGSKVALTNVISFVLAELSQITSSQACQQLLDVMDADALLAMVRHDKLCWYTNLTLIEFIMKWMERSNDRAPVLAEVMGEINLLCFDEDTLDTIANMTLIRKDEECRKLVATAKDNLLAISTATDENLCMVSVLNNELKLFGIMNKTAVDLKGVFSSTQFDSSSSVLAVGGILFICSRPIRRTTGEWFSSCHSFDPRRSRWKELACLQRLQQGYGDISLACVDGEVCIIDNNVHTCRMKIYNFSKDEWRAVQGGSLLANKTSLKVAALNGNLYLLCHNKDYEWEFLYYNLECQLWEAKKTPFSDTRHGQTNQKSSVRGTGRGRRRGCGRSYWTAQTSATTRDYLCYPGRLVAGKDRVYIFPSETDTPNVINVESYSPRTDEWMALKISHSFGRILDMYAAPHAGHIYISARYKDFRPGSKLPSDANSGVFRLDPGSNSITFLTESDFCLGFVVLNIPKKSVDMLKERNTPSNQRPESVFSLRDVSQAFASVNVGRSGYM